VKKRNNDRFGRVTNISGSSSRTMPNTPQLSFLLYFAYFMLFTLRHRVAACYPRKGKARCDDRHVTWITFFLSLRITIVVPENDSLALLDSWFSERKAKVLLVAIVQPSCVPSRQASRKFRSSQPSTACLDWRWNFFLCHIGCVGKMSGGIFRN
jgi:hypothetical protein